MSQPNQFLELLGKLLAEHGPERLAECFSFLYGAFVITRDGVVVGANSEFIELSGYDPSELYGTPAAQLIPPKEQEAMLDRFANDDTSRYELELLPRSGDLRQVLVFPSSFDVEGERYRLAQFVDITEERKRIIELADSLLNTVGAIARTVEMRDPYTAGHMSRTTGLATAIATELELSVGSTTGLSMASTIHDLGKIHIAAEILNRPGQLSDTEFELIKSHSQVGYDIIKDIDFNWPVADIVLQHHERLDGSGYPQGLKDDEICLEAQILTVADMTEAISSHRPYRAALGIDFALEILQEETGTRLNSDAVDACTDLCRKKSFVFQDYK